MTTISVVIPARDETQRLPWTLDSLADQETTTDFEVIVVASDPETESVARDHPIVDQVVQDEQTAGAGPARNRGAATARGEILAFTDADTVVSRTWVRDHTHHYVDSSVVCVGGPLRPFEDSRRHRLCFRVLSDWWYRVSWPIGFVQAAGCNCSVRRSAFDAVGGFDETLSFLEDTDLSLRLRRQGDVVYDPTLPVRTSARRQESEGYVGLFFAYLRGYLAYFIPGLHPSRSHF